MSTILNIFTPLYSWCTSLGERLQMQDDFIAYYQNYFDGTSVCAQVLLVATIVALVTACIYYFACCNLSFYAAKRYIWVIVLGFSFVATLFITPTVVVGHYDQAGLVDGESHTLLFQSAKQTLEGILMTTDDDESREEVIQVAEGYADLFRGTGNESAPIAMFTMPERIPLQMSLVNGIYSMLLFFVLSIIFKRFTIHGKAIPF